MQRRWTAVTAAWIAIVFGAGVVAAVTWDPGDPPVATLLARFDRFVSHTKGFKFEGRGEQVTVMDSHRQTDSYTVSGTVGANDVARFLVVGDEALEIISVGDRTVARTAERPIDLKDEKWAQYEDVGDALEDSATVPGEDISPPVLTGHLRDTAIDPAIVGHDHGRPVIRFRIEPEAGGEGFEVVDAHVELTLSANGRPYRLVAHSTIKIELEDQDLTVEGSADYRFSDWDKAVDVAFPADADIDQTPDIDEEAIAAFHEAPLLQPRAIPSGWKLDYATVLGKAETTEGCPEVELDYIDPVDPDVGYLYLYELAASCAATAAPRGATPFRAGAYQGWLLVDKDDGTTGQIVAGRTAVQFETDLPAATLARVLADLIPLDLTKPPASLPK